MAKKPQLRPWSADEIRVLPKKLRDQYFGQDTSEWKFKKKTGINDDEIEAISPLLKSVKFREIYYVPEVDYPQGIKTPDLIIDGVKIEIKTPRSLKKISDVQRYANKQTDNGILLLNLSKIENVTKQEIKQSVEEVAKRRGGSGIVVQGQKILFTYKRKSDSETAIHSVSNPESLYGLILSQKPGKVNRGREPKLRKQTHAYWQKRSVKRTLESERQSLPYLRQARQVYAKSAREITKQVQDIYAKYYRDNGFDVQALRQLAPQGDVRRLKARMRKLGLETNLPDNYAYRVRRLEMLNMQMRAEAYEAGQKIKQLTGKSLAKTYENGYYRTIYDTAKGIGHTPAFSRLNKETVSKVLDAKNYGKNFSERIWGRSQKLSDELQSIIGTAIATGQSPAKTTRLIRERFNVSANSAERLIRTETNYFENQAEIDAYKEMGVGEYQFLATIDTRTSEVCQGHDHKTYKVSEAKVGVNMPPLHPNCVLPETEIIANDIYSATKSYYSGNIIQFVTSDGRVIRVTPNHIVPTARGFIRAKFLSKGDQVINDSFLRKNAMTSPADNIRIASAENLFASLVESSSMSSFSVPATAKHLKGDVVPGNNIDIVFINSLLRDKRNVSFNEFIDDRGFIFASKLLKTKFPRLSSATKLLMCIALASDGVMSGFSIGDISRLTSVSHHELISLLQTALYDARLSQTTIDNCRGNAKILSKLLDTLTTQIFSNDSRTIDQFSFCQSDSGFVESSLNNTTTTAKVVGNLDRTDSRLIHFDDVVDVDVVFYSGHVYDFSTLSTLYSANGVLSSNCRSTITAYFGKEWEPEVRIARNPQTGRNEYVTNMSYEEWFGKITDGTIETIKPAKQINQVVPDGFFGFNAVLIEAYEKIPIEEANDDLFVKSKYTINNRDILLSGAELKFLSKLDELDIRYEVIPEQPGGNGTNDFKIFNQEWELKTRIKTDATTIMWALIKATDKNKENIILDVSYMDKPLSWVFNKVDEHLEKNKNAHKIKKIVIVRGKKFIQYK